MEYKCKKCPAEFDDRTKALEHGKKPLIELPEGFIYFRSGFRQGFIRGNEIGANRLHDVSYHFHVFADPLGIPSIRIGSNVHFAETVRENLAELGDGYREATDEEIERVLSQERIVNALIGQGLTELTLDLEGERTVPIVYQPILT